MKACILVFLIGLCGVMPITGGALAAQTELFDRPAAAEGGPTRVHVAIGLVDIDEINSADQNFTANLFITVRWHDPRLAHAGTGNIMRPLNEVWNPYLQFVNQQKIWPTFPEVVRIAPDGTVKYAQRVWGPFSQPLDVREFPFDSQDFIVRVVAAGLGPDEVVFVPDETRESGLAPEFSLPDWEVVSWKVDYTPYSTIATEESASFGLVLHARRYVSHYVLKIILPLVFIVSMSWLVFWVDPNQSGVQFGVATTSMLTLIAYRFAIGSRIPPVPYLTCLDRFILLSTVLVFASLVQVVVTSAMAANNRLEGARRLDRVCRLLFPAFFAVICFLTLIP